MVVSPDGAVVEPRDGNVWVANDYTDDAVEAVIGAASLLYYLTAALCMSGIFFSVFQMGQLSQIKKALTKTYISRIRWSMLLAIQQAEYAMHAWFWATILTLSLTQRPWVLYAATAIYVLLFVAYTTQYLRMKQVGAKEYTHAKAILELKETRGALPQSMQEILDKHVK